MKNKILIMFVGLLAFSVLACEPIEKRDVLSSSVSDASQVDVTVTNTTAGGNELTLKLNTPGITGYWDYNLGKEFTDEVTLVYPIPGTSSFKYIGSLGDKFFEKEVEFTITNMDHAIDPMWNMLVSDDITAGKTWVLATDRPAGMEPYPYGPSAMYSFMSDPSNWLGLWWNAGECCPPVDVDAEMKFDLDGAANYTYTLDGVETKGSFILDISNSLLKIFDADLVGAYGAPGQISDTQDGVYQLEVLSDTEMILYQVHGTGWTWIFKPKGYVYPGK